MDGQTFRSLITELGFKSLGDFAVWIEVNDRTAARWVENGPPTSVCMLILMMLSHGETPNVVKSRLLLFNCQEDAE